MRKKGEGEETRRTFGRPVVDADRRSHVGRTIRKYRTAAGMDQADVAAALGCTKTAVGNWELSLTRPDIDNVAKLCSLLHIPVTELLGIEEVMSLTNDDRNFLKMYHNLDRFNRRTVWQIMDRLLFQQDSREKERLRSSYEPLCLYEDAAAAGIGGPMLDYAENKRMYVLRDNVPHGSDGIIHVNGRSMEPTFEDGSYVYIDSDAEVKPGQIGVFIVNGEAFIKEYRPDGLYSHNSRYKPIIVSEGSNVRCCGRVTGVVGEGDIAIGSLLERIEAAFEEIEVSI